MLRCSLMNGGYALSQEYACGIVRSRHRFGSSLGDTAEAPENLHILRNHATGGKQGGGRGQHAPRESLLVAGWGAIGSAQIFVGCGREDEQHALSKADVQFWLRGCGGGGRG